MIRFLLIHFQNDESNAQFAYLSVRAHMHTTTICNSTRFTHCKFKCKRDYLLQLIPSARAVLSVVGWLVGMGQTNDIATGGMKAFRNLSRRVEFPNDLDPVSLGHAR